MVVWLYLSASILGFGTFAIQMLFSSAADADAGDAAPPLGGGDAGGHLLPGAGEPGAGEPGAGGAGPLEPHAGGAAAEASAGGADGPGGAGSQAHDGAAHGPGWAGMFLSLRFYLFAAMGFGTVGTPASWLGWAPPTATLVAATIAALLLGVGGSLAFRALSGQTLTSGASQVDLPGQLGRVLIACEKGRRGKVRVQVRGQLVDLLATTEEERLEPGSAVIVQEVGRESVLVCAAPRELSPAWGRDPHQSDRQD